MHSHCEEKSDDSKDGFVKNYSRVLIIFYLGFNAKWGENIFKLTIGNESLHQNSNDNGVRIVKFATSKNLVVKSTKF
jgi:hypothetical protein